MADLQHPLPIPAPGLLHFPWLFLPLPALIPPIPPFPTIYRACLAARKDGWKETQQIKGQRQKRGSEKPLTLPEGAMQICSHRQ